MTVIQLSRPGGGAGTRPGGGTSNRPRPTAPTQPPRPNKALLDSGRFRRVIAVAAAIAIVTGFSAPLVAQAWTAEVLSLLLLVGLLPLQLLGGELLRRSLHMSRPGLGAAAWEPCLARAKQESHGRTNGRGSRSPTRSSHSTKGRVEMPNVPNTPEVAVTAFAQQLPAALRAGATDVHQAAALDILLGLPHALYARQDLRSRYISHILGAPGRIYEATVLWTTLHDDLRTGQAPVSSGERRMLLIACSIAAPSNPVSLNEVLAGLDSPNALLILAAVERIVRGHR